MIIHCSEDADDHTIHKFSLSVVVLIKIGCVFLPADLFELQVKNACFESRKFYE